MKTQNTNLFKYIFWINIYLGQSHIY